MRHFDRDRGRGRSEAPSRSQGPPFPLPERAIRPDFRRVRRSGGAAPSASFGVARLFAQDQAETVYVGSQDRQRNRPFETRGAMTEDPVKTVMLEVIDRGFDRRVLLARLEEGRLCLALLIGLAQPAVSVRRAGGLGRFRHGAGMALSKRGRSGSRAEHRDPDTPSRVHECKRSQ